MSIYAISDLHLALSIDKPMDIFGSRWANYMEKLKLEWENTVSDGDTVIVPGDISWATYLEQAVEDFQYIERLPGRKIISKGNHDYWWTTHSKLEKFLSEYSFTTVSFMHNNSYDLGSVVLCGTRGWKCPGDDDFNSEDEKIYKRELQRLEMSLKSAPEDSKRMVALHYPPFDSKKEPSEFVSIMKTYGVEKCIYGHLHSDGLKNAVDVVREGIEFRTVSADHLNFKPLKLY